MKGNRKMKKTALILVSVIVINGCGTTNNLLANKSKTVEYYRIFDIKTTASKQTVIDAASNGLGRNTNNIQEETPISNTTNLPDSPSRFKIINPLAGSNLGTLASMAGGNLYLKTATCDGAIWIARAKRDIANSSNLNVTLCLYQYKSGYHLNQYGVFNKQEGGLMQISRSLAYSVVGTPEAWTEKAFLDVVRNIQKVTGAKITLLEAQPKIQGTPWLDNYDKL